ncbi:hypothetical protein FHT92_005926 [Rhizobium sp. BK377]|jgi:hypothetical protein|nr:hypothetical protein [Rhizobium sp. BK377]
MPTKCCPPANRMTHGWVPHCIQIDSTHWLLIFIHPNGIVQAVVESADLIDVIQDQAKSGTL